MSVTRWLQTKARRSFAAAVLRWYDAHRRDLPWRATTDPYAILVSEIMLQQTQIITVLRYYDRFLARFPTVAALAAADEQEVLRAWEGLGYYRRARFLHRAAQAVLEHHGGQFPEQADQLARLPGLGRYTANAVACFAFGQRVPLLEANTLRLWSRLTASRGVPTRGRLNQQLWYVAEQALPRRRVDDYNQALMDLGSGVCTPRQPKCGECPLRRFCRSYAKGIVDQVPGRLPSIKPVLREDVCILVQGPRGVLVTQIPQGQPWAGLWELPRVELGHGESIEGACRRAAGRCGLGSINVLGPCAEVRHAIMHLRVRLRCCVVTARGLRKASLTTGCHWVKPEALEHLPFSTPQRRILRKRFSTAGEVMP